MKGERLSLVNVLTPEQFEVLLQKVPQYELTSITNGGRVIKILDPNEIKIIKKGILNYIKAWKNESSKYSSALALVEDILEDYNDFKDGEENYISSMRTNLRGIEANLARSNRSPTEKQTIAMRNLQHGIHTYENETKNDKKYFPTLFNQPNAYNKLNDFIRYNFGEQYSEAYYKANSDYNEKWMDSVIRNCPRSDAFEGDLSQDPSEW
jgi:hypothetical protein